MLRHRQDVGIETAVCVDVGVGDEDGDGGREGSTTVGVNYLHHHLHTNNTITH